MGGRGSSGGYRSIQKGGKLFKMSADNSVSKATKNGRFPVEANTQIKTKTQDEALKQFTKKFKDADHEYMYEIDNNGYVHNFVEGGKHSVSFTDTRYSSKKQNMIVHNHPSGSNLSPQDLKTFANSNQKSVVAVGSTHSYTVTKGTHFKASEFLKGLSSAKAYYSDYNRSTDKWLKDNQKKYGYVYKNTRVRVKSENNK